MNFELLSFAESFISTMLADSIDWHVKNLTHVQQETKSVRIEQDFAKPQTTHLRSRTRKKEKKKKPSQFMISVHTIMHMDYAINEFTV